MTTRLSDAGKYASMDLDYTVGKHCRRLDGLDAESAVDLILRASDVREHDKKTAQAANDIATALDYHPLGLVVASSVIQSSAYSLQEYADALASRFTQQELLDTVSEQATYRKVSTTFEVSVDFEDIGSGRYVCTALDCAA
jgi:hypothetical protein